MADTEEIDDISIRPPAKPPEDPPALDCPPCKVGAPAWMATFADMATLLMAFFVLILSFAHVNEPKFKNVSGSMKIAFGVQTIIPVIEPPSAMNIIATQYIRAKVEPTPLKTVEEQRTNDPQPEDPELSVDVGVADEITNAALEILEQALAEQIAEGQISVSIIDNELTVSLFESDSKDKSQSSQEGQTSGQIDNELLEIFATIAQTQEQTQVAVQVTDRTENPLIQNSLGAGKAERNETEQSSQREDQYQMIRVNLSQQIQQGLAEVERDGDAIIIRLAEQGTFDSGQAQLKPAFYGLLDNVGSAIDGASGQISIEGHTDNVPIGFGSRYRNNWDLSAARSAAVADYLLSRNLVTAGNVTIAGFADTKPIEDNGSADGQAKNRRIEIIIAND